MAFAVLHNAWFNPSQSGELKALFSHGKPRPDANSVRGFPCKNKAFLFSWDSTQRGRCVRKVYHSLHVEFTLLPHRLIVTACDLWSVWCYAPAFRGQKSHQTSHMKLPWRSQKIFPPGNATYLRSERVQLAWKWWCTCTNWSPKVPNIW